MCRQGEDREGKAGREDGRGKGTPVYIFKFSLEKPMMPQASALQVSPFLWTPTIL